MIERIVNWFRVAKPEPNKKDFAIQLGCHFEEYGEMCDSLGMYVHKAQIDRFADILKKTDVDVTKHTDKTALCDALCDQIVTAVGVGCMMGFDMVGALEEVMKSNESKFENGAAVFDENGKIKKGKDYFKPDLTRFVGE